MNSVAADHAPSPVNGAPAAAARSAMIYTRMGVVFHASTWAESAYGINAVAVAFKLDHCIQLVVR